MTDLTLEDRAARNQSLVREYNERMALSNAVHYWVDPPFPDWVCECADQSCEEPVRLAIDEYEAIRKIPTHFLVMPSDEHVVPEVEVVVERTDRYWVVEKTGHAAAVAEKFDPRSRKPLE